MLVTVHQPEHLPWLGFFHKVDQADVLVLLDVVQYRKDYFQNRNRILGPNGPQWLTVPVRRRGYTGRRLVEMEINNDVRRTNGVDWRRRHWKTIQTAYGRHPFFVRYGPELRRRIYDQDWKRLVDLNVAIIEWFLEVLGIATKVTLGSNLSVHGARSDLLLSISRAAGADTYLSGSSGREYLDEEIFHEAGIEVAYHRFEHPTYPQRGADAFVPSLSTLDLVMNCAERSLEVIRSGTPTA